MFDDNRKFGFITICDAKGGGDVFMHQKEVQHGKRFREGDSVEFDTRFRGVDALRACDITALGERAKRAVKARVAAAKESGRPSTLSSVFAISGSAHRTADVDPHALPAGLTSAADLRARQESIERAQALADEESATTAAGKRKADNLKAAAALRDSTGAGSRAGSRDEAERRATNPAKSNSSKTKKKKLKGDQRRAAQLSFSVGDDETYQLQPAKPLGMVDIPFGIASGAVLRCSPAVQSSSTGMDPPVHSRLQGVSPEVHASDKLPRGPKRPPGLESSTQRLGLPTGDGGG
eukprot:CAMPEP_0172603030 /NCGR_PEP_ID=MMETSP1068-20121228/23222_1 /TAXON_ID=35684 /ORGANISM="Pseudopedinella elastica, Strain CCMP716" /LENGTH=292 /DNA_ID=CAMNT_0013404601 /DNA_START=9 /DNA_END=889 /DNA_ORIENTATION=+